jgi:hypothetical protein
MQHDAQDAVDAEPRVPEAGVVGQPHLHMRETLSATYSRKKTASDAPIARPRVRAQSKAAATTTMQPIR